MHEQNFLSIYLSHSRKFRLKRLWKSFYDEHAPQWKLLMVDEVPKGRSTRRFPNKIDICDGVSYTHFTTDICSCFLLIKYSLFADPLHVETCVFWLKYLFLIRMLPYTHEFRLEQNNEHTTNNIVFVHIYWCYKIRSLMRALEQTDVCERGRV